ncbi:hypothetical protein BDV96DRAFT_197259 [Lophiotrema nucula]|uniref:Uncharacterized protein n=1 Tax=Lophiotrema nucula TaxID=690887 RepID=A0A6A5YVW1_9PLEO|nr:hypothetical protein BDV96DRAFT_197259 [Lophiotrema nucula]
MFSGYLGQPKLLHTVSLSGLIPDSVYYISSCFRHRDDARNLRIWPSRLAYAVQMKFICNLQLPASGDVFPGLARKSQMKSDRGQHFLRSHSNGDLIVPATFSPRFHYPGFGAALKIRVWLGTSAAVKAPASCLSGPTSFGSHCLATHHWS